MILWPIHVAHWLIRSGFREIPCRPALSMRLLLPWVPRAPTFWMALIASSTLASAAPLSTAFTYQGRLFDQNTLANGPYDLRFGLFDAATSGAQVGPLRTNVAVAVSNGVFTVTLDFGAAAFGNAARWLELGVRPGGGTAAFAPLSGRQALTPVPQAQYASAAGTASTATTANGLAATAVVPGTLVWQAVAGTTQAAQSNRGYVLTNEAPVKVTLPAAPSVGDVVRVNGVGAGGWTVAPNAGQFIGGPPGTTWTSRGPSGDWRSVASSADGTKLVAVGGRTAIWTSTDSGQTWVARGDSADWRSVASSADGTKLVAVGWRTAIWTSTDSGQTWVARGDNADWRSVASSADGTKLVAVGNNTQIQISNNSGQTWVSQGEVRKWRAVASSANGTKLVAVGESDGIWTSTDSGQTWVARGDNADWRSVASSADGTKLVAVGDNTQILTSNNSGQNWVPRGPFGVWSAVASSADGTKLAAVGQGIATWISTDAGLTWNPRGDSAFRSSVASSADGTKLVVSTYSNGETPGALWTSPYGVALAEAGGTSSAFQYVGNNRWAPIPDLTDNSAISVKLTDNSVTTPKLTDNSVTAPKLADNSVTTAKLTDSSVSTPKLTDSSVTAAKLASDSSSVNRVSAGLLTIANNKLGIGTADPHSALHIRPSDGYGEALTLGGNSVSGGFTALGLGIAAEKGGHGFIQAVKSSGTAYGDLALNPNGGDVYIGNNIRVSSDLYVDGYLKGKFGGNYYNLDKAAGAAIWSSSDQRLKQDITPIPDALAAIKKLRGVTYHWNQTGLDHLSQDIEKSWESASRTPEDNRKLWEEKRREADAQNSKLQTGFVAQEVEQVFPDWVKTGDDGYKQIDMSRLNAVLVNALHEQQDQIEAQQRRLASQQAQMDQQSQRLAALERRLEGLGATGTETATASLGK